MDLTGIFYPNIFGLWLVESGDVKRSDVEPRRTGSMSLPCQRFSWALQFACVSFNFFVSELRLFFHKMYTLLHDSI